MHPDVTSSMLLKMVAMEADPNFFKQLSLESLIELPPAIRENMTRDALERLMDAICTAAQPK